MEQSYDFPNDSEETPKDMGKNKIIITKLKHVHILGFTVCIGTVSTSVGFEICTY